MLAAIVMLVVLWPAIIENPGPVIVTHDCTPVSSLLCRLAADRRLHFAAAGPVYRPRPHGSPAAVVLPCYCCRVVSR